MNLPVKLTGDKDVGHDPIVKPTKRVVAFWPQNPLGWFTLLHGLPVFLQPFRPLCADSLEELPFS